jgi:hypothetical protein
MSDKISWDVAEAVLEKALTKIGRLPNDPELHLSRTVFGNLMFEALLICYPKYTLRREGDFTIKFKKSDDTTIEGQATLDRLFNTFEGSDPGIIWRRLIQIVIELQRMITVFDNPEVLANPSKESLVPLLKLRGQVDHWNNEMKLPGMPVGKSNGFLNWPAFSDVVMVSRSTLPTTTSSSVARS